MAYDPPDIVIPDLSRRVKIEGVTVHIKIYRLEPDPNWALVVFSEDGFCTIWDELFTTETLAFAAFESTVQDDGMVSFLADGNEEATIH